MASYRNVNPLSPTDTAYIAGLIAGFLACLFLLIGHFQEDQIDDLLGIIASSHTIARQDVDIVPDFVDNNFRRAHDSSSSSGGNSACSCTINAGISSTTVL